MSLTGAIAVYVILWWLVFFMVLPIGSREVIDTDEVAQGQDAGSPKRPRLLLKILATTVVSALVFAVVYWVIDAGYVRLNPYAE